MRYITERCVFELTSDGLELIELAPGIDLQTQVLDLLPFRPITDNVQPMDASIFRDQPMGLRDRLFDIHIEDRLAYDTDTNTVFMDYSGMRVRSAEDLTAIKDAVDGLLGPLGQRVYSVVNYDKFEVDSELEDDYFELVHYVQETYYLSARRYTNDAFQRLKLVHGLEKHDVDAQLDDLA